jgi:hypothetical protein
MKTLPSFLKRYFWDIDFQKLNKKAYRYFIIERILEYGDEKAVKWMKQTFKLEEIKDTLFHSKNLSFKSANFWQLIFNVDRNKILCLKKLSQKR